jgi:hypothetical protein
LVIVIVFTLTRRSTPTEPGIPTEKQNQTRKENLLPPPSPHDSPEGIVRAALAASAPGGNFEQFVAPLDQPTFKDSWSRVEGVRGAVNETAAVVEAELGANQGVEVRRLFRDPFAGVGTVVPVTDTRFRSGELVLHTVRFGDKWYVAFNDRQADDPQSLYARCAAIDKRGAPLRSALKVLREGVSSKAVTGANFPDAMAQIQFLAAAGR